MSDETFERAAETQEEREERIRLAAYFLWKESGEPEGADLDHWLNAEEYGEEG
ncbi:DUF2934 domain-containing protein [Pelodictyon luteolum]|jgi:hypothetical protein|uniref:DUF2934 domain-containing protein n=1 Tax=Pelodictyon luteolum TaxID=1100 RepID=UPI0009D705C8|nr:DUF2934 domain-containing protein [Pelodictyon luteolum]